MGIMYKLEGCITAKIPENHWVKIMLYIITKLHNKAQQREVL